MAPPFGWFGEGVGSMLVELSVMEQRYQAVLAVVQDGWKVVEVARRLGVSRQSVHSWISRYERGGLASLADRSHRPPSCAHQIAAELEAQICEIRRQHPGWGPRRIEFELARAGVEVLPSRSSIYRCLRRHGLIELRRRRKRRDEFRRWERERPMQLWQMDVMGGVLLDDGSEFKVVTGVDDHSRFCIAAGLVRRATSKAVCEVLSASLRVYGIPDEILTDNGKVFTGRFGPHPVEVMFDRICRENGISHRHTGVRSPTTTGKIERFHQSLRKEFLADSSWRSLKAAQSALDRWVADYNTVRPHQALDMATPADRFRLEPAAKDQALVPVDHREDQRGQWVLRRVASNGIMSVDNQMFSVGNAFKAQLVDVFVDDSVIQVWHKNHLIKTVARIRTGPVRKVRADGLHVKDQPTTNDKHQLTLDRGHHNNSQRFCCVGNEFIARVAPTGLDLHGPAQTVGARGDVGRGGAQLLPPRRLSLGRPLPPVLLDHFRPAVERAFADKPHLLALRFHDLRHTSAALAIALNANPKTIQQRLGHASIQTTFDVYGHLFEGHDGELADALGEVYRGAVGRPAEAR